jgi:hypothetical protein
MVARCEVASERLGNRPQPPATFRSTHFLYFTLVQRVGAGSEEFRLNSDRIRSTMDEQILPLTGSPAPISTLRTRP